MGSNTAINLAPGNQLPQRLISHVIHESFASQKQIIQKVDSREHTVGTAEDFIQGKTKGGKGVS